MNKEQINEIVHNSKQFSFEGSVLTVTNYYDSKKELVLDLAKLTPEMVEQLGYEEEED